MVLKIDSAFGKTLNFAKGLMFIYKIRGLGIFKSLISKIGLKVKTITLQWTSKFKKLKIGPGF